MNPGFDEIFTGPENSIFKVVFFPDRIYHAAYLNATTSPRYRYNVQEVRGKSDISILKGEVYMDGRFLTNFVRVEYRGHRLVEAAREKQRFVRHELMAWIRLLPEDATQQAEATIKLHYCNWVDAYQAEIWGTLEPLPGTTHDYKVLGQMGRDGPITRIAGFSPALQEIKQLKRLLVAFRENQTDLPYGFTITDPQWDNNYLRTHQEPRTDEPSSPTNTVADNNYEIDFRRGWYLQARDVSPVRYRNGMMAEGNPEARPDNIIEMRWLLQQEFGSTLVFFHEVTIPPGTIEGTHQHIGSEELYYIVEGEGIAYMGRGDDPTTEAVDPATGEPRYRTVEREIFGLGKHECKELPVRAGNVIYTKSGGIHGIRCVGEKPLRFVAFLYHST